MTTASTDRAALRLNVNCSRWLTELRQRADSRIATYEDSRLDGDKRLAGEACKAVAAQATAEGNVALAEAYDKRRAALFG